MNVTLVMAVVRARRRGLLRLVPAAGPTRLECLGGACAKCCRNLGSPRVSEEEAVRIEAGALVRTRAACFVKSSGSVCCLLVDGLCSIYGNRPRGCVEYPWYNIGGRLYYDRGCPGMRHDWDERPEASEIGSFEDFFAGMPRAIVAAIRWLCTAE